MTHTPLDSQHVTWDYIPLQDITITAGVAAPQIRLTCSEDEGGPVFTVYCDNLHELQPYADLLCAWKADSTSVEAPVVPVHIASGRYYFSPAGACFDYPDLERPAGFQNFARHFRRIRKLTAQIQDAAKNQAAPSPEHALTPFIKQST